MQRVGRRVAALAAGAEASHSRVQISACGLRVATPTAPLSCCAPVTQYGKR